MSDLIITARLRADARGFVGDLRLSRAELDRLGDSSGRTERDLGRLSRQTSTVSSMFLNMRNVVAGIALGALSRSIVSTNAEFQKLTASLETVTGSSAGAQAALDWINDFATQTPYQLNEVVGAFIKLKALGLDPSEAALRSYGNTASAMGKSLDQFIEAVADAATGEFERLKEFGIKASQQGNEVVFTFQGVKTTVAKDASAISDYLRKIGDVNFAGAMEKQMSTLGGAFSNLQDNVDRFYRAIGEAGLNDALMELTQEISSLIGGSSDLGAQLGQLAGQGISLVTEGLRLLVEHSDLVLGALAGIAAVKTASTLISIGSAAVQATAALAAFAFTPVGAITIALGLATAAIVAFGDETVKINGKTATVTDYVVAAWEMTRDAVVAGYGWMADASATAWQAAEDYASGGWSQKLGNLWIKIAEIAKSNINAMIGAFVSVGDIGSLLVDDLYLNFKWLFDAIGKYYTWLVETAGQVADKIGEFFGKTTEFAKEALKEIGVAAAEELGRADLGEKINRAVEGNFNRDWLADAWKASADLATPVIDDVASRAAQRYQKRIAETKPAPVTKPEPATGIENNPGGGNTAPVITAQQQTAHANAIKRIKQGYLDLLPPQERNIEAAKQWYEEALKGLDANQKGYAEFKAEADEVYQYLIEQGSTDWQAGLKRGLREIGEEASDMASQTERALTNFNRAGENAFVGLTRGTKTFSQAFGDMADSIINDILRMIYQQQIAKPIAGFASDFLTSFIGGFSFGGTTNFDSSAAHYNGGRTGVNTSAVGSFHSGGMVRNGGENPRMLPHSLFDNAPRFHSGRIPGLKPGELAAVLKDDEEVLTADNPRHIFNAGRSGSINGNPGMIMIEPKFEITLENQTGQDMAQPTVESRGTKNGAQQLYILLKPMIANDIANGSLGKQIGSQFNTSQSLINR